MKTVKKKLDEMLKGKENDVYVLAIISALFERSRDNPALAEAILKDDKNWEGCWSYIRSNAEKEAKDGCACIEDEKVYGWAVDYFFEETPPEVKSEPAEGKKTKRSAPRHKPAKVEEDVVVSDEDSNQYGQLTMKF